MLLAQKIVGDYHKDKGRARCTLKVDLMRTYNSLSSVEWEFLFQCLTCFGIPSKFVEWIKEC